MLKITFKSFLPSFKIYSLISIYVEKPFSYKELNLTIRASLAPRSALFCNALLYTIFTRGQIHKSTNQQIRNIQNTLQELEESA